MKRISLSWSIAILWCTLLGAQGDPITSGRPFAFTHVTLIDATGAPAQPDMTVVVSGNRITEVGKFGSVAIPKTALIMNEKNRFMIPGLWDMHQHAIMRKNKMLPLLTLYLNVANGVTGVRDMGDQGVRDDFGDFPYVQGFEWRQAVEAGAVLGPQLVMAGVIVDGPNAPRAGWASIANETEARQEVRSLKALGADFIKVLDRVPRDAYFALADEARRQSLPFAGHVPFAITVAEASDAGQKSIEHLSKVLLACSRNESELMKGSGGQASAPADIKVLLDSYAEDKAASVFAKLAKNHTYSVPTLVLAAQGLEPVPMNDPRIAKYLSPSIREDYAKRLTGINPENVPAQRSSYQAHQRLVLAMQRAGVRTMAGTDTWWSYGFSVHDELAELVKAGLTPMEALQAATSIPAEFLGRQDSMGTVEKGRRADLVLLDANPLERIENTQRIRAVVVNGRPLDRPALDRLLRQVEAAANHSTRGTT